jgi:hypothetical protein
MAYDWQWANDFLSRGRKKYERPLYDRGLRIFKTNKWDADSDINVAYPWISQTPFVTYHKDGTTTIKAPSFPHGWSSLRGYSTRFTIQRYAGISVMQRNFKFYLQEYDAPLTAPKIQGCRTCSQSGLVDGWCWSPTCYEGKLDGNGKMYCETHPEANYIGQMHQYRWHKMECKHGLTDGHPVTKDIVCGTCQGTKKYDYGSKPERTQWDGTPLKLRDGKIIKSAATILERMIADNVEFVIG